MASNELERAASNMESAIRQILNGLEQVQAVIEYYNAHDLSTELSGITEADTLIVSTGNGITKARLADLAYFGDSALKLLYDIGDGSGNTLLGRTPNTPAEMVTNEQKINI
jgi:hypothetical protein